jgi:hypothetical protein
VRGWVGLRLLNPAKSAFRTATVAPGRIPASVSPDACVLCKGMAWTQMSVAKTTAAQWNSGS